LGTEEKGYGTPVTAADTDLDRSRDDQDAPVARTDGEPVVVSGARRADVVVAVLATFAAVAPFVAVIAIRAGHHYLLTQDLAVIDLRTRDVLSAHPPLTGPWSRAGFAHPGPLFYWVLGVLSGITAQASWSILVGGAAVRIAGIVTTARLAWTRGGVALCLLVVGAITAAQVALEPGSLVVPWNIFAALAFLPVFLLLAWSIVLGEVRRLPWLVVVGTFLVQTHIGYGLLLLAPSVWVAIRVVRDRRATPQRTFRRAVGWSIVWLVLLWLPVLIDQLFVTGNVGAIADYVLHTSEPKAGFARSIGWFAERFRLLPTWVGGPRRIDAVSGFASGSSPFWLFVPAALLAVAVVAVRRRGDRAQRTFVGLVALMTASAIVSMAQITGDQFAYLFEWRTVIGLLIVAATVWALVPWLRTRRARRAAGVALLAVIVFTSTVLVLRVADLPTELRPDDGYVGRVSVHLADRAPKTGHFLVRGIGPQGLGFTATLVNELDRRGVPVRVDRHLDYQYGPQRVMSAADARSIWLITERGWIGSRLRAIPGARIVYASTGLGPAQERELQRAQLRLLHQLLAVGQGNLANSLDSQLFALLVAKVPGVDQDLARRVATLDARSARHSVCRCVVVAFDNPGARVRRDIDRLSTS
jgi:hypothetical protein